MSESGVSLTEEQREALAALESGDRSAWRGDRQFVFYECLHALEALGLAAFSASHQAYVTTEAGRAVLNFAGREALR